MNKRSSGSDRPRSARLRRRPSIAQEDEQESIPHSFDAEQSELTNRKNAKPKPELNLLETSNRLGMKNKIFGRNKEKAGHNLAVPSSIELMQDAKNANFVNFYQRNGREPPKSPRILPKLEKNGARKAMPEEKTAAKSEASNIDFSIFLDEKKVNGGGLHLGKHYSVLPNISHSNETGDDDVSLQ